MGAREPTYFLRARYVSAIQDLGGLPFILPLTDSKEAMGEVLGRIDGLLLTGSGPDLDPSLYGELKRLKYKVMSPLRAEFELTMARRGAQEDLPILGLCGGMQVLNVALGGSLIQDIGVECERPLRHQQKEAATRPSHRVRIEAGTLLAEIVGRQDMQVNSSHHQAVRTLGKGLRVNARAEDEIIEGIELPGSAFALGVQWHPEFLYREDDFNRKIFQAFLDAAARRRS